eukprot:1146948-Pelagomonas_calceolata.AAC.3
MLEGKDEAKGRAETDHEGDKQTHLGDREMLWKGEVGPGAPLVLRFAAREADKITALQHMNCTLSSFLHAELLFYGWQIMGGAKARKRSCTAVLQAKSFSRKRISKTQSHLCQKEAPSKG